MALGRSGKVGVGGVLYRYNGKELNQDLGLYDYGARNYDPAIGRWLQIDPLAETMPGWSGYNYVYNDPISLIDPLGLSPYKYNWKTGAYENENGTEVTWETVNGSLESGCCGNPAGYLKTKLTSLAEGARQWMNSMLGTKAELTTAGSPSMRFGKVELSVSGNIQAGAGVSAEVDAGFIDVKLKADAGSIQVVRGEISSEAGVSGSIAEHDNNTMEREFGMSASAFGEGVKVGVSGSQEITEQDGQIVSEKLSGSAGISAGGATLGLGTGIDAKGPDGVKITNLSVSTELQLILGFEVKASAKFKTANRPQDLDK